MEKVLICSAKGGSGKTTVTLSLAFSLADLGYRVGVIDGDVSTPDCHRFVRVERDLEVLKDASSYRVIPAEVSNKRFSNSVKLLSLGLLAPDAPFIWDSKYMEGAIDQLVLNTLWGGVDVILIDSPPTLHIDFQKFAEYATRAVLVVLPDRVSFVGAKRCLEALSIIGTPVVGYILNMSYLKCECGRVHRIFRDPDDIDLGIPKIGELPIVQERPFKIDFAEEILKRKPIDLSKKSLKTRFIKFLMGGLNGWGKKSD